MFFFWPSISHLCLVVSVDMDVDRSSLNKPTITIPTGVGLHTSVETLMIQQSSPGCESFPTIFANVRPLPSVGSLVFFNNTVVNRAKVTMIALELFFGCLSVKI